MKLEGTDEYIEESICKDASLFELVSQTGQDTCEHKLILRNIETNETIQDVYPFTENRFVYKLKSGEYVQADCGGTKITQNNDINISKFFLHSTDRDFPIRGWFGPPSR